MPQLNILTGGESSGGGTADSENGSGSSSSSGSLAGPGIVGGSGSGDVTSYLKKKIARRLDLKSSSTPTSRHRNMMMLPSITEEAEGYISGSPRGLTDAIGGWGDLLKQSNKNKSKSLEILVKSSLESARINYEEIGE